MPQLDIVTLFSQVFWLVLLYFIFFLIFIKYFLPHFSKVFKVRSCFFKTKFLKTQDVTSQFYQSSFLEPIFQGLRSILHRFSTYIERFEKWVHKTGAELIFLTTTKTNLLFLKKYLLAGIKFKVHKKTYFL